MTTETTQVSVELHVKQTHAGHPQPVWPAGSASGGLRIVAVSEHINTGALPHESRGKRKKKERKSHGCIGAKCF